MTETNFQIEGILVKITQITVTTNTTEITIKTIIQDEIEAIARTTDTIAIKKNQALININFC